MSPKRGAQKSAKSTTAIGKTFKGFTNEERAAMKERAQELKAASRADKADGESDVLAAIAAARLCRGRQGRLLLPTRSEVQDQVRDARLQRQGEPRRRRHVADLLRAEGVDRS
jgi:hypothetical protein